ncbi:MAG: signal peptidase I, partial [Alphaproteobacteria bacterium]|nr:signal peptidase I [Alphaproteobacteria bacterium]
RAERLFFSQDGSAKIWQFWKWLFAVRYSRLFQEIT